MAIFSSNKSRDKREGVDLSSQFSANNEENVHGVSTISMETTITGTIESNSLFKMDGVLNGDIKGNKLARQTQRITTVSTNHVADACQRHSSHPRP